MITIKLKSKDKRWLKRINKVGLDWLEKYAVELLENGFESRFIDKDMYTQILDDNIIQDHYYKKCSHCGKGTLTAKLYAKKSKNKFIEMYIYRCDSCRYIEPMFDTYDKAITT